MASFIAGTTFADGVANDVTAAKLGALITAATPTSGFIQDRTAETVTATNDTLLIGDASDSNSLKRITVANFAQTLPTAKITTGTIETGTFGTTTSTAATITTGTIPTLVATTLVTTGTGSAAAPAIVPTGDTNTGIFFPAADTIAFSEGGTESIRIDSSGNVGIRVVTPISSLHIKNATPVSKITLEDSSTNRIGQIAGGSDGSGGYLAFSAGNNGGSISERLRITSVGEVYIAGVTDQGAYNLQVNGTGVWGAGAYVNGSDERLKENIQDITSGLDVVEKLRPVSFQYKEEYTADRSIQSGFIAQDLLVALEGKNYLEGVVSQGPTYYNVAYQNLIPILAKAIQELKAENDSLKARIEILEAA